ncbi:MAG: alpha/beta hydrolase, partial [Planctomycetota bacterium]
MAQFEEISVTLPDGYRAYGRYWDAADPRGAVLYHHGIQSHCGWYGASAARLAEAGFSVLQMDRRGSGRNSVDRGHAESVDQMTGDTLAARDELARRCGSDEHHVIGVSWGGK